MKNRLNIVLKYITDNFPGPFMNYMREQVKASQLQNSSLYEITKLAFSATNLDELYKSIHESISKLMYADNMYIALYDENNNIVSFPYYIDKYDNFKDREIKFDEQTLTCKCIMNSKPLLLNKIEFGEFYHNFTQKDNTSSTYGTVS